jgi:hypothetical protein
MAVDIGSGQSNSHLSEQGISPKGGINAGPQSWPRPHSSDGQTFTGFTCLIIATISLGCVLVGYLSGNDVLPLLLTSGTGLIATSVWYAHSKLFRFSLFFGSFAGFVYTYALIQLGITNGWYGVPIQDLTHLVSTYFAIWFVIFLIVAAAMRFMSPLLTSMLLVTDAGVALILLANVRGSLDLLTSAAAPVFALPLLCLIFLSTTTLKDRRKGLRKTNTSASDASSRSEVATSTAQ